MEAFTPMRTRHPQKKRSFSNCDKTNPMMNDNYPKPKSVCGLLGNSFQLMLGHFTMCLVIDSLNFAAILDWSDYTPEVNNRASGGDVARTRCKGGLCY